MRRTLTSLALLTVICAAATAQVVQLEPRTFVSDPWGKYFDANGKTTFSGRVTGIEVTPGLGTKENDVSLTVRNRDGGGTTVVELGPSWYVKDQDAKLHTGDEVQITGSKVMVGGHGMIVAQHVRVHGQGGPVLTLRKPSGRAYWMDAYVPTTRVASNTPDTTPVTPPALPDNPPVIAYVPVAPPIIQENGGMLNVDTGAGWYGPWNYSYQVGNYTNVISGPNPIILSPQGWNSPNGYFWRW